MHFNLNDDRFIEDPSEAEIRDGLATLAVDAFAILARGEEQYVQVYHNDDGTFQLEYRVGSYQQHFAAAQPPAIENVQDVFVAYATAGDQWNGCWPWEKMEFDEDFEGDLGDVSAYNGYLLNGQEYEKVPVGDERQTTVDADGRCPECGLSRGSFHSPDCELEECPRCHGLLIECGCDDDD